VTPTEGSLAIRSLRELRNADLPNWAKDDLLADLGHTSQSRDGSPTEPTATVFARLSAAQLDRPIEPAIAFDVDAVADTVRARSNQIPGQPRGLCGGRWKNKTKKFDADIDGRKGLLNIDKDFDLGNGSRAEVESSGAIDGSLSIVAVIHYRERSNKCIGIPYRWEFKYADIDFEAEMDGAIEMNNTVTLENKARLWQHIIPLLKHKKTIPIAKVLTVDLNMYLQLQLALDLETELKITNQTKFDQDYDIRGRYETHLRCDSDGCENREAPDWGVEFIPVDRPSNTTQTTVNVTLRPSAELQLGLKVEVGVLGKFEEKVFDGILAVGVDIPIRLFWTNGNACSDANGDGRNEPVSGSLVDVKLRVYAYVKADLLGEKTHEFISLRVPNGWTRKRLRGLLDFDERVPVAERHLLLKVLSEGEHSPLQPTIKRAGLFRLGNRDFEGVELGPVRSCYPFDADPTIRVDFGDGTNHRMFRVTGAALPIPHDWSDDGRNRTVRARVEFDANKRTIKGPWVEVKIDRNGNLFVELQTPVLRLGSGPNGAELQWQNNGAARGFNVYRDGRYAATVRDATSWPLHNEDGQQHRYSVVAFDDQTSTYTPASNEVVYANSGSGGDRPAAIVSMGDSFISGEGGRWYGNALSASKAGTDRGRQAYVDGSDQNNCHRSDVAEVNSAAIPGLIPINLACSGAEGRHVRDTVFKGERPQVEQLRAKAESHDVEMIVLSIGGNDLGFGPILANCMQNYIIGGSPCRHNRVYGDIVSDVIPEVRQTIQAIQTTMRQAGDTDYRLVLQSYPSPVARSSETRYSGRSERIEGGCGFHSTDLDWARDTIVPLLDALYGSLAREMGVEFLSLRNALQGKEVCAKNVHRASTSRPGTATGQDAGLEWVRFGNPALAATQGELAEVLHPNALGQAALGDCLAQVWQRSGSRVHTCVRSGPTPTDMSVR
jgi:lysophospholipase L1-like esterase